MSMKGNTLVTRYQPLDDIAIEQDGTGRTVTAYATVFRTPVPISDGEGTYVEQIGEQAFTKTLAERSRAIGCFYNHGATLHGTPSDRHSLPIGKPLEVKADGKGLLTRTRYNKTALADEVLESIKNGDITGQSFSGRMIKSDPVRPAGGYRSSRSDGGLTLVTRHEIALVEYGPTPMPAYADAVILGVRAVQPRAISDGEAAILTLLLDKLSQADSQFDWFVSSVLAADEALEEAQAVIAALLNVEDPDNNDTDEGLRSNLQSLATRLTAAAASRAGTPSGAAAGEPTTSGHSGPAAHRALRARLLKMGPLA